jgi:hypothetical protein
MLRLHVDYELGPYEIAMHSDNMLIESLSTKSTRVDAVYKRRIDVFFMA